MKMTKGKAFIICLLSIMIIFISMFVLAVIKELFDMIPVGACLTALCSITGGYIGIQMVNNGVKGKNWCQQMFDSENKIIITETEDKNVKAGNSN